jgi:peptidoglycan/LPS O-acetylase OafA/YrhL
MRSEGVVSAYRPDIDGLRAVAVLAVVGYHYFPMWVKGGFVGVDIFFVISGFLIGGILIDALRVNRFSFFGFYARRIRRIFPALIVVLVSCLAFGWFALLPDDYQNLGKHTAGGAGFIANLMFWQEAGYFDVAAERKPLLHLWSLGVEEQFYIVFPLVLFGLWKKNLRLATFVFLLALVSYKWNLATYKKNPVFDFYMPVTRFWELFAGVLLALWERRDSAATALVWRWVSPVIFRDAEIARGEGFRSLMSVAGLALLAYAVYKASEERFPGTQALFPVFSGVLLIAAGPKAFVNRLLLACKPAVWIGLISYPLYLWHWPIFSYARIIYGEMPERTLRIGMFSGVLCLAALTYFLVEKPVRYGKNRAAKVVVLVILLFATGFSGWMVCDNGGVRQRKAISDVAMVVNNFHKSYTSNAVEECKKRYQLNDCLFYKSTTDDTVALVGDSIARLAYPAVAEFADSIGVNTFFYSRAGYGNPITGWLCDDAICRHRPYDEEQSNRMFHVINQDSNIRKVFILLRGPLYVNGQNFTRGDMPKQSEDDFSRKLQSSVNIFVNSGKKVFIVATSPEPLVNIRDVLPVQPFRPLKHKFKLYKKDVLQHQEKYLSILSRIKNATVINTIDSFCPNDECLLTINGELLYLDHCHLTSYTGGKFLVDKVLKPYLVP